MTIHIEHPDLILPKCGNFEKGDYFTTPGIDAPADCIECIHYDEVQAEWEKYVALPINFGPDPDPIAERDAFFAAAYTFIKKQYPF